VVGLYDVNRFTSWSNYVVVIPPPPPAFRWAYTLRTSGMDIYDLGTPSDPLLGVTLAGGGSGVPLVQVSDATYMWINDGTTLLTYTWFGHELLPVLSNTLAHAVHAVIRRGLGSRDNLLFIYNTSTFNIESYNISDPTSPSLVSSASFVAPFDPLHGFGTISSLCYDAGGNRLLVAIYSGGSASNIYSMSVASDGTLGTMLLVAAVDPSSGSTIGEMFVYNNLVWVQSRFNTYTPYKLDGSGAGTGSFSLLGNAYDWLGFPPRIRGKYLFLGCGNANGAHQAIVIYDLMSGAVVAQLGGLGATCDTLLTSQNLLVFSIASVLYTYDITGLLASGSAPVSLGSITGPASLHGITGYYTDGWEGNNGMCAT
jgi:hypothetical protein